MTRSFCENFRSEIISKFAIRNTVNSKLNPLKCIANDVETERMNAIDLSVIFAIRFFSLAMFAQKNVTIKVGTIVLLISVNQVKAADVTEGQTVDFRVLQNVNVDGLCVIPQGTLVKGKVVEARKSTVGGTKGKLIISITNLTLDNGEPLYFTNTDVRVYGHNRTPVAVVVGLFTGFGFLIPGSKAVMPANYEVQATVATNATVTVK